MGAPQWLIGENWHKKRDVYMPERIRNMAESVCRWVDAFSVFLIDSSGFIFFLWNEGMLWDKCEINMMN